jgi:porin
LVLAGALLAGLPLAHAQVKKPPSVPAGEVPRGFGGPSSVLGTLFRRSQMEAILLGPYFSFKNRVEEDYGLAFGFDYQALYQIADSSPGAESAAGGIFRLFGRWALVNRDTPNRGTFGYKVENRHRLGTTLAPQDLAFEVGYAGQTDIVIGDMGWMLTNLSWEQHFAGDRGAFVAGIVDTTDYVDTYGLIDPWIGFNNMAFSTNPTIPAPGQGLGAAFRANITEQLYVVGGIADANGDPADPGRAWRSFFDGGEHFTHVEIGWFPAFERRFNDNVHITFWHADALAEVEVPGGWGLAASWCWVLGERWEPFLRAGSASGGAALWERSISTGFGYSLLGGRDLLGAGFNWGRPSRDSFGPDLKDQYTAEVFYRWRPLRVLTVIPDFQLLVNPALDESKHLVPVFGMRLSLTL